MKLALLTYRWLVAWLVLQLLFVLTACEDKEQEPHPALLYNICELAEASDAGAVFHLYRPDADQPVILTAEGLSVANENGEFPASGTAGMLAYYPAIGEPYKDSAVSVTYWAAINNLKLRIPAPEEADAYLADWGAEAVRYLAGWRGGDKLYLRLQLPYSTIPRRFGLVADPATLADDFPRVYLCHERKEDAPTFDRQYYFAFDIASIWSLPDVKGLRLMVNDAVTGSVREFIFYKNS